MRSVGSDTTPYGHPAAPPLAADAELLLRPPPLLPPVRPAFSVRVATESRPNTLAAVNVCVSTRPTRILDGRRPGSIFVACACADRARP